MLRHFIETMALFPEKKRRTIKIPGRPCDLTITQTPIGYTITRHHSTGLVEAWTFTDEEIGRLKLLLEEISNC